MDNMYLTDGVYLDGDNTKVDMCVNGNQYNFILNDSENGDEAE